MSEPRTYCTPDDQADAADVSNAFAAAVAKAPSLRIVFSDELDAFKKELIEQLNGALARMARRLERRIEKRVGDRTENLAIDVLKKAGYGDR